MRKNLFLFMGLVAAGGLGSLLFRPESAPATFRPASQRRTLPEGKLQSLEGASWSLADHRGSVVLLNYWASWCPPCRQETPGLVRVAGEFAGKGLVTAGVTLDERREDARRFVAQYGVSYPVLLPEGDPIAAQLPSLPTTFLIDRHGRVATMFTGAVSESTLRQAIGKLLAE